MRNKLLVQLSETRWVDPRAIEALLYEPRTGTTIVVLQSGEYLYVSGKSPRDILVAITEAEPWDNE